MSNYVNSYRDLNMYKLARQLAQEIFHISKQFPREEMYSLTDQIRRSSRSVGAQIAEAWATRRYTANGLKMDKSTTILQAKHAYAT